MVARVNQAARLLGSFHFGEVYYCHVGIYFKNCLGQVFGASPDEYNQPGYMQWSKKQWRDFILSSYKKYDREYRLTTKKDVVAAITIWFKKEKNVFAKSYHIEASHLYEKDCFDRLLIEQDYLGIYFLGDSHEVHLTKNESSRIHGTSDVIKLTDSIPEARISAEIVSGTAKVMEDRNRMCGLLMPIDVGMARTYPSTIRMVEREKPQSWFPKKEPFGKP